MVNDEQLNIQYEVMPIADSLRMKKRSDHVDGDDGQIMTCRISQCQCEVNRDNTLHLDARQAHRGPMRY